MESGGNSYSQRGELANALHRTTKIDRTSDVIYPLMRCDDTQTSSPQSHYETSATTRGHSPGCPASRLPRSRETNADRLRGCHRPEETGEPGHGLQSGGQTWLSEHRGCQGGHRCSARGAWVGVGRDGPTGVQCRQQGEVGEGHTGIPIYCSLPILQNKVYFKTFLRKLPSPPKEGKSFLPRANLE